MKRIPNKIRAIIADLKSGMEYKDIRALRGVSKASVSRIASQHGLSRRTKGGSEITTATMATRRAYELARLTRELIYQPLAWYD